MLGTIRKFLVGFYFSFFVVGSYILFRSEQIIYALVLFFAASLVVVFILKIGGLKRGEANREAPMRKKGEIYPSKSGKSTNPIDNDLFDGEKSEDPKQKARVNSAMVKRLEYYKRALAIFFGLITILVAGYYIFKIVQEMPEKNVKLWQATIFSISLGSASIYYFYNSHKFKGISDKIGFFSGVALGPPTAIGFLL